MFITPVNKQDGFSTDSRKPSLSVEQTPFSLLFIFLVSELKCKEGQIHKNSIRNRSKLPLFR